MDFSSAMKELMKGKSIKKENDTAWYTKDSVLELPLRVIYEDFMKYDRWIVSDDDS